MIITGLSFIILKWVMYIFYCGLIVMIMRTNGPALTFVRLTAIHQVYRYMKHYLQMNNLRKSRIKSLTKTEVFRLPSFYLNHFLMKICCQLVFPMKCFRLYVAVVQGTIWRLRKNSYRSKPLKL